MNKKVVRLEKMVLTPLEFRSEETPTWIKSYYDNIAQNAIKDESKIFTIKKKQVQASKKASTHDGVANITILDKFFNLKVKRRENVYEFETQNEEKLIKKFEEIV